MNSVFDEVRSMEKPEQASAANQSVFDEVRNTKPDANSIFKPDANSIFQSALDAANNSGKGAFDLTRGRPWESAKGAGEAALNQVSGAGANIIGGWRGIYSGLEALARGETFDSAMNQAANAVNEEVTNRTYQPQTQAGENASAVLNLPGQAIDWVANKAGEATTNVVGPGAGALVRTGIDAIPMAFLRGAGSKNVSMPSPMLAPTTMEALSQIAPQSYPPSIPGRPPVGVTPAPATESAVVGMPVGTPSPIQTTSQIRNAGTVSTAEQAARAKVLESVGLDKARISSLEGHPLNAASDFQMTRFNEPAGVAAKDQFAAEKAALQSHTENMIERGGGTVGMDQEARLARGNTILAPLDSLRQWFDDNTKRLYDAARERGKGQAVTLTGTQDLLDQKSNFSGNTDSLQLRKGVQDRMQELGMMDDDGKVAASTVDQAENLRKYLNENWSPKNNHLISKLKDSIDDDVTRVAGDDIFKQARAMRALRATTLDDPKGIAGIMDADGINRKVATENIASHITSMTPPQFSHIIDTLKGVPDEIQPLAQKAISEIKGHMLNQALEAGSSTRAGNPRAIWNHTGVDKYINDHSSMFNSGLFAPEEIRDIQNLQHAGRILSVDPTYPGAAAQAANALKSGLMSKAIGRAAQLAGGGIGSIAGPMGAAGGSVAGEVVGAKLAHRFGEGAALKRFNQGVVKLSDVVNPEP